MGHVVFSTKKDLMGRIGQERMDGSAAVIEYCDGSEEIVEQPNGLNFGYRDSGVVK